jgi:uncharacterized protein YceK
MKKIIIGIILTILISGCSSKNLGLEKSPCAKTDVLIQEVQNV